MNSKILTVGAVALGLLLATWFFQSTFRDEANGVAERPSTESDQSGSKMESMPSVFPPLERADESDSGDSHVARWLARMSADAGLQQSNREKINHPASITIGGLTVDLGETPPWYYHQLVGRDCIVLLSESNDRHFYRRGLTTALIAADDLVVEHQSTVIIPRFSSLATEVATQGGFVFRRDENAVYNVGVIIPEIRVPPRSDPQSLQWSVRIRVRNKLCAYEEFVVTESLTPDSGNVVVMPTQQDAPIPVSAQVVWFEIGDDGALNFTHREATRD